MLVQRVVVLLATTLPIGWGSMPEVGPCSAFALHGDNEVLLAKNFDWHFGGGYLVKNPRGVLRRALPLFGGRAASWAAAHGSLTFTQYGAGLPYGGINERGLAIEMLWLDETVYPSTGERTIGELEWIQYQLDMRASVHEVVANVAEFSIRPIGGKIHYLLADASGDRALVEFVDGSARVQRGEGALVCTNDTHRLSELAFQTIRDTGLRGNSSRVRYARLRLEVEAPKVVTSVAGAFAALERVTERGSPYRTQWAVVYEVRKGRVHCRPDGSVPAFEIDATALDYAPRSGTAFQDLFGKAPVRDGAFMPLTEAVQLELLTRNLSKVGLDRQLPAIASHLLDPFESGVVPLEDRLTLRVRVRAKAAGGFGRIAVFRSQAELTRRRAETVGSVLLDTREREFAFYNLPLGTYAVGAFHDRNQNGRPDADEPLAFYRGPAAGKAAGFADLAFALEGASMAVVIELE